MHPRTYAWPLALTAIVCASSPGAGAQTPAQSPQTVQWHVTVASARTVEPGQRSIIELTGQILEGWHVYGLKQHPDGPTELRFSVDDNPVVQPAGTATGSDTIRRMDRGFGFEIKYYTDSLTLSLPIVVKQHASTGQQQVPVSVRFQSCSERVCLPPATIHLLVDINVQPHV